MASALRNAIQTFKPVLKLLQFHLQYLGLARATRQLHDSNNDGQSTSQEQNGFHKVPLGIERARFLPMEMGLLGNVWYPSPAAHLATGGTLSRWERDYFFAARFNSSSMTLARSS